MTTVYKIDLHRRICLNKDLSELCSWLTMLEAFNLELDSLSIIEKQLICNTSVFNEIKAIRRKNVLSMANLCKYEQELIREIEYGKEEYSVSRVKLHNQKRDSYMLLLENYNTFKNNFYILLKKFKRK